jgi:hypothetical protein
MSDDTSSKTTSTSKASYGFVKGGTLTTAYENQLKRRKAEADQRRAEDDKRKAIARANPCEAKLHTLKVGGQSSHPMVVLVVKAARDNTILDYVICELLSNDGEELILNMACPKCATRGIADNFKIHQSNRKFEFEQGKVPRALARQVVGGLWVNPNDPKEAVTLAGTINLVEPTRCPNLGCDYRFKIDDSVLRPV